MVKEYFPGGWHGHDREGRPVFLLRSHLYPCYRDCYRDCCLPLSLFLSLLLSLSLFDEVVVVDLVNSLKCIFFNTRLGQMDAKGLIKSVGEEGLTKLTLHICEEGIKLTEEASHRYWQTFVSKSLIKFQKCSGSTSQYPLGQCYSTWKV